MRTLRSLIASLPIPAAATVAAAALLAASHIALHAQATETLASSSVTAGPYFAGGASTHIGPVRGEKVFPVFAYRAGGTITFPLTRALAATLDLGYDRRGIGRVSIESTYDYEVTRVGYFTFAPGFALKAFWLGLNLGIPIDAGRRWREGFSSKERSAALADDEFDKVEYLVEPRIGAMVPILDNEDGLLALRFTAGFTLNELSLGDEVPVEQSHLLGNYQIVSAHLGLTYQFVIPETSR